jgi:CheY-like chemotaxis protein
MGQSAVNNSFQKASSTNVGAGLLVCNNEATTKIVQSSLEKVAISTEVCSDAAMCLKLVGRRKFEVVFVDFFQAEDAYVAIQHVRASTSSRTAVVIAITINAAQSREAFTAGAQFVVQQPITSSGVDTVLKAAYGLIIRERRRYFRCPVESEIIGQRNTEGAWSGRVLNISEGGLCILPAVPLASGDMLEIELRLPETSIEVSAGCQVKWTDVSGRAGLQFRSMSSDVGADLQHWLAQQLEATFTVPPKPITHQRSVN